MMNSEATLIRTMKMLLRGMNQVMDYVDDLLVHTPTWQGRMRIPREFFRWLRQANLTVRPKKCMLGPGTIDFFGHRLKTGSNRSSGRERGESSGCTKTQDQQGGPRILGLVGCCKEFIPNFSAISALLSDHRCLKIAKTSRPLLNLTDIGCRFVLRTDAFDRGLGTVLMQRSQSKLLPVVYENGFGFF
ncbi:Zinc finger protein [Plakobranchus ocellatus]|uniref:Zinc finger protein n=1 Tax=Plakobranchus ocellatus TaxID=259542 RepID=A0AAV4D4R9_9GAST|nr:Zinc finger protein [Plakobranchus ocellatus]